jgi:glycosyltransferase involved in cell wall biosynthesis
MRILFALNSFRPHIDGVSVSIERQANGLSARGHDITVIAPSPQFSSYLDTSGSFPVHRLRTLAVSGEHRRFPVFPGGAVRRALSDFRPDAVVVSLPFLLSRTTWNEARRQGYPVVGITSVMPEWFYYNFSSLRPFVRLIHEGLWGIITDYYNRCDHVVGVTTTALNFLVARGLRRPTSVISNGVPLDRFVPRPRDPELASRFSIPNKPTVLYAGRLDADKCMEVWLQAIPRVLEKIDAHFVVGGDGNERGRLERLSRELGVGDAVTFVGFLSEQDYPRLFSMADVFAISSPAELQSVVTLEAAASGLPIVAARAGALPEIVADGRNGRLVEPGDSSSFAEAIIQVLDDPRGRAAMARASRKVALEHDLQRTVEKYEEIYLEVSQAKATDDRRYAARARARPVSV